MERPSNVWAAMATRRYLVSSWPWRSYAYLISSIPVGVLTIVLLGGAVALSAVLSPLIVGILMFSAFPLLGVLIGRVERWRAKLMLPAGIPSPHAVMPAGMSRRDRFRFRRREQGSLRGLGYGVLLGTFVWVFSAAFGGLSLSVLVITLMAPLIATDDELGMGPWTLDTTGEGFLFLVTFGPAWYVVTSYLLGCLAGAEAALARSMLGPREDELRRNVAELRRSRLDLVDAFETERARIERHLHDGVQQRLVGLTMTLGLAELDLPEGDGKTLVVKAHREAEAALADLREAVRGIHPRVLVDLGLEAAVREVADRSPLPVSVRMSLPNRLPAPIEAAAYFFVSEALANVAKHAEATRCDVEAWVSGDRLVVTVTDDGRGGADPAAGTGLTGLVTRLDALGGTLDLSSPPGGPTRLRMESPCRLDD
ncbi:histidine kinase [Kribbella flavida DSM 17836]|uniref:histidine kinase n=1 Tax=Kribbella flavida (strain DSM 17836 / JCM 10339 / NBRC 14399) TaxID=479435 RepID=D2PLT5_KRIFD|nr:sensor domain-containing protein [Kribbella flavida]ADB32515.1 histidine kinase [Kribbella flavida DSM 17836]